jgi:hypothetical protein
MSIEDYLAKTLQQLEQIYAQMDSVALRRMADDFCNEIFFLLLPQGDSSNSSDDQIRFLGNFFQEEFDKPGDPLRSA